MNPAVSAFKNQAEGLISLNSLFSQSEGDWPILHDAALHGVAGDIVRTISPHTEADPIAILVQFLVFFGNVIGRHAHFMAESDRHALVEYVVLIGETSKARKGTSQGHVKRIFENIDEEWSRQCIASGLSTGEGLLHATRDAGNDDSNYQEIDKRLLVLEGEFASVLRVMSRDGNTLSSTLRNLWDSGNHRSLVKRDPLRTTGAHVSLIGHITVEELLRYLDHTDCANGWANRILFPCVRRSKLLPEGGDFDQSTLAPSITRLADAALFAQFTGEIHRDDKARELWCEEYERISASRPGLVGKMLSRAEAHVMRLASLYALLDKSELITPDHLSAALALWDYCEQSVRYIFKDSFGDPDADLILRALQESDAGLSRTQISGLFHGHKPREQIESALSLLANSNIAEHREVKTRGRTGERWFLLPTAK
jgi:phage gp37-like protein